MEIVYSCLTNSKQISMFGWKQKPTNQFIGKPNQFIGRLQNCWSNLSRCWKCHGNVFCLGISFVISFSLSFRFRFLHQVICLYCAILHHSRSIKQQGGFFSTSLFKNPWKVDQQLQIFQIVSKIMKQLMFFQLVGFT